MTTTVYQTRPTIPFATRIKKSLFASPLDCVVTIACAIFFAVLIYWIIDWAFLSSIWTEENEPLCRDTEGACWSVIDARHRIIFFGLFPYEEHWRSTLACVVMIVTIVASCFSWFWRATRLAVLWVVGFDFLLSDAWWGVWLECHYARALGRACLNHLYFCSRIVTRYAFISTTRSGKTFEATGYR